MSGKSAFVIDKEKYYSVLSNPKSFLQRAKIWLINYGFHCVAVFRFGQAADRIFSKNRLLGFIPVVIHRLLNQRMVIRHHVEIDRKARIGGGLLLMHYSGIFIGPVVIGENCTIHHNVTIGQRVAYGDRGVPTLGKDVWIGPGCIITGSIKIGDGVTISAGSVVSKDFPDRSLIAGNPGRVIMQDYDNSAIMNFKVPE